MQEFLNASFDVKLSEFNADELIVNEVNQLDKLVFQHQASPISYLLDKCQFYCLRKPVRNNLHDLVFDSSVVAHLGFSVLCGCAV